MAEVNRQRRVVVGAAAVLAGIIALWAVAHDFRGGFSGHVGVTAEVEQVGDSLAVGNIVTYRDVIVGEVHGFAPAGLGARLSLRLQPDLASSIPANVTAIAVPVDLFGATEVVLVPPKRSGGTLRSGQTVPANRSAGVAGLQTALADAYDLVSAVRPAELSAALTALGNAINGRGDQLHDLVRQANTTLRTIAPTLPRLSATLENFATVTDQLAAETPNLLASVGNLLAPAREIVRIQSTIATLLGVATTTAGNAAALLEATGDDFVTIVTTQVPFLRALAASPGLAGSLVTGLGDVVRGINSIAPRGRLRANAFVSGINLAGIVQTYLGKPSVVLNSSADPPLYTSADCPRYPGAAGPNCGRARVSTVSTRAYSGAPGSSVAGEQESEVATLLASTITGLKPGQIAPGIGALLAPLLRGSTVVIP